MAWPHGEIRAKEHAHDKFFWTWKLVPVATNIVIVVVVGVLVIRFSSP